MALLLSLPLCAQTKAEQAAANLAGRVLPRLHAGIEFVEVPSMEDFYVLESVGGKIRISGNSANSMAMGLGDYLRDWCLITPTWYSRDAIKEPRNLPAISGRVERKALVKNRFFLNYCTYGYTVGWWQWDQWERLIDWMALNGVNMALANTGQESVWQQVWMKLGLSQEQTLAYFPGPSFLSWHRMTNMDSWHGPMPQHWLDAQRDLQKQIIAREVELGISPILGSFTGHVPKALKELYPDADIRKLSAWGKFPVEYNPWYLNPNDPLYPRIQKLFLQEQKALYGQDCHVYGIDLFNEVDPPSWEPEYLEDVARRTYEILSETDPDAVWLQMSWLFFHKHKSWTPERIAAYIKPVPAHRLIMLDYYCDKVEIYKQTDAFHDQDFIWSYLGNFGGNTMIAGNVEDISAKLDIVLSGDVKNCVGVGCTLEGLDVNPQMYEYVLGRAWEVGGDDAIWFQKLADRRLGKVDKYYRQCWELMRTKVHKHCAGNVASLIPHRPNLRGRHSWNKIQNDYSNDDLLEVWKCLTKVCPTKSPSYRFDCVNIPRQWLDNYFSELYMQLLEAYKAGGADEVRHIGTAMLEILDDVDALVASDAYFLLGRWIEEARSWGNTPEMKDYMEWDAKDILSCWGYKGGHLTDYANRDWNGLIGTYYKPRWERFLSLLEASLTSGEPFDDDAFLTWCNDFEWNWIGEKREYLCEPSGDPASLCRKLYRKYTKLNNK